MERSWKEKTCFKCNSIFRTQSVTNDVCKICRMHKYSEKTCKVCKKIHTNSGVSCSKTCAEILKKESYMKSCGSNHNFSKNSISRIEMEERLFKNEGIKNVFQRNIVKDQIRKTMEGKYGRWFSSSEYGKNIIKNSNIFKYGDSSIMKTLEGVKRLREANILKYGESSWTKTHEGKKRMSKITREVRNSLEFKNAMYDKGMWLNPEEFNEIEKYYFHVELETKKSLLELGKGKFGENWKDKRKFRDHHIDHIFPIIKGFNFQIPVDLIGSIKNLRLIPMSENLSKGSKIIEIPHHIKKWLNENNKNI